jgi:hypothetical protein
VCVSSFSVVIVVASLLIHRSRKSNCLCPVCSTDAVVLLRLTMGWYSDSPETSVIEYYCVLDGCGTLRASPASDDHTKYLLDLLLASYVPLPMEIAASTVGRIRMSGSALRRAGAHKAGVDNRCNPIKL